MISLQEIEWAKTAAKGLPEKQDNPLRPRVMTNEELIQMILSEGPSRMHFRQVADIIKTIKNTGERQRMADHHAGIFAKQNPRFNHAKWHNWIGTTWTKPSTHTKIASEETLDELTKKKLGDYKDKAIADKEDADYEAASADSVKQARKPLVRSWKRSRGIAAADKKLEKEEADLSEVITKKTSTGKVIDDFVHSDNKKFSGDSKKQRIKRALGAWYGMHRGEETESTNEEKQRVVFQVGRTKWTKKDFRKVDPSYGFSSKQDQDPKVKGSLASYRDKIYKARTAKLRSK
jgi:hypothetical protein